ncbi:MAG: DUF3179 domain-containing (seleno)protein [Planctomycetota bacterium]
MGLIPVVGGRVMHLSAGGLFNGLVLLVDDETETFWDHLTGDAVYGLRVGGRLPTFPIRVVRADAALREDPELRVAISDLGLGPKLFSRVKDPYAAEGRLPPGFRGTMGEPDERLPEQTQGLGLVVGRVRRFYPFSRLGRETMDRIAGREVVIENDPDVGPPFARWRDGGSPTQLHSRWYGFSYTWPDAEIWAPETGVSR